MKDYNILVEAQSFIDVQADSEEDAEVLAKQIMTSNPYAWDSFTATVIGSGKEIEE